VQRRAWEDCVDAAGFVVLVPAAARVFPDGVFDPFLRVVVSEAWARERCDNRLFCSYLDVFVKLVCDVLSWGPAAEVLVLHLFDPLNGVFGD
jgi:hypothetical protein